MVWFRNDLRLTDNAALHAAAKKGAVLPVYIVDPPSPNTWQEGAASHWWLHHALAALDGSLRKKGGALTLKSGAPIDVLTRLIKETGAEAVYWNLRFEPHLFAADQQLKKQLEAQGVEVRTFNSSLLFDPRKVLNKQGKPYRVFTAYWKNCEATIEIPEPLPAPRKIDFMPVGGSLSLDELNLLPLKNWADGFAKEWQPGEAGAKKKLRRFIDSAADNYSEGRDRPDQVGTSRLSPHLHFGELSPRTVFHAAAECGGSGAEAFIRQLGWREFAHHLLWYYPETPLEPLHPKYKNFPWHKNRKALTAWQQGLTGFPIVDAGMRELWATGWMHNRVRMIVASFLVKDLLIPWQEGARWFWDTLVDADLANNTLGWQWVAGCGADAAPYFRIFNPMSQGAKFDPHGDYVRRWIPEIADLPHKYLHRPWEAPPELLESCGIELGRTYPRPIVDHAMARQRALGAYASIKD
jgi:deoxyribodipyrimidine photo-lyase